jgi:hypothetical protein
MHAINLDSWKFLRNVNFQSFSNVTLPDNRFVTTILMTYQPSFENVHQLISHKYNIKFTQTQGLTVLTVQYWSRICQSP